MKDARGNRDEFCEGSGAAVVAAGDAEDLAVIAKIHVTAKTIGAGAAVYGGVESDPIAGSETLYSGADGGDDTGGFVSHDDGGNPATGRAIVAVDVTAADAAGGDADEDFVVGGGGHREVGELEIFVGGEEECFHGWRKIIREEGLATRDQ